MSLVTSRIFWYPSATGLLEKIDIGSGAGVTNVTELHLRATSGAESWAGGASSVAYGGTNGVKVEIADFADGDLVRELRNFQTHAQRGGLFGFALDNTKVFGGWLASPPSNGDTTVTHKGNVYYTPANTIQAGDEIVLSSPNPEGHIEWHTVASVSGAVVTLDSPVLYDYAGAVHIRHKDFIPVLYWPPKSHSKGLIEVDRRVIWRFAMEMVVDWGALIATDGNGQQVVRPDGLLSGNTLDALAFESFGREHRGSFGVRN